MKIEIEIEIDVDMKNNEGTASPWWMIIDPLMGPSAEHMITGPFFSRGEAQGHLSGRRYNFSSGSYVYCASGCHAPMYSNAIRKAAEAEKEGE